jgi:hypothetical protein
MITQNKLFLAMSVSYFIGTGVGYILKTDNSILFSKIVAVFFGLGFATYVVATVLDIKEK